MRLVQTHPAQSAAQKSPILQQGLPPAITPCMVEGGTQLQGELGKMHLPKK